MKTIPANASTRPHPKLNVYGPVALLLIGGLLSVAWWKWHHNPQRMLKQAEEVCQLEPIRGLQLLDDCIQAAGGQFTEAQLLKCKVQVKHGRAKDAAEGFAAIRDWPTAERSQWLPRLIELVQTEYECVEEKLAVEHCEKLEALDPENSVPWLISAAVYHQNSQPLRALQAYRQAFARRPHPREMLRISYQIVTLALHAGDISGARAQLNELLKLAEDKSLSNDRDQEAFHVIEATVLQREQAIPESLTVVDRTLARWPNSTGARLVRGGIYLDQGKLNEAIADLEFVINQNPFEGRAHYKLGQAYSRLGQDDKAKTHLDASHHLTQLQMKILQLQEEFFNNPNNPQLAQDLAELNDQHGDKGLGDYWRRAVLRASLRLPSK